MHIAVKPINVGYLFYFIKHLNIICCLIIDSFVNKNDLGAASTRKRRNLIGAAAQGAGINEVDGYVSDNNRKVKTNNKTKQTMAPTLEDNIAASLSNNKLLMTEENPFKVIIYC